MGKDTKKLGLVGLTAIVFGSMIGSGIFNIVQNMAYKASAGAVIISWLITAAGILCLVLTFKVLSNLRPDLDAGIYQYAQTGFGDYVGFNMAWGYWLCTAFSNVAYAVMLNDSLGVFFPVLLEHHWASMIFGSTLIWGMFALVIHGIHSASVINTIISALKISALFLIVVILILAFKIRQFDFDFWGRESGLGSLGEQIRCTMMVTLWCFIGIEGAVMMSARAKRAADVGRASIIGFLLAWVLYAVISIAAFGAMGQEEMAKLGNPSVAYLLRYICGDWAYYFVIISVICSLLGGWIAWTLICAQVPYEAAQQRIMPSTFLYLNSKGVPTHGLFLASVIMEVFFLGVFMAKGIYMAAIEISGMMILPAYLFCGLFLWKASYKPQYYLHLSSSRNVKLYRCLGILCSLYCFWLIYSGGLHLLLLTSLFYLPGIYFYIRARQQNEGPISVKGIFSHQDRWILIGLCICCVISLFVLL